MNIRKAVLTFLSNCLVLTCALPATAQQLPQIIWNQPARGTETGQFLTPTYSIKFSADGQRVFSGGNRKYGSPETARITVFNAADGAFLGTNSNFFPVNSINELEISPDGQKVFTAINSASCDFLQIDCIYSYLSYNAQTLARVSEPPTSRYSSKSVDFSPQNQLVVIGDYAPTDNIKFLDPTTLLVVRTLPGHVLGPNNGRTLSVRFSPDGRLLASGGGDDTVKIWRVSDSALLRTLPMGSPLLKVFSVEFSPDGQYLAAADTDYTSKVKVWRVSDGALVKTFTNPYFFSVPSHRVTWTRDGRYIVSTFTTGNDPSRIRFWDFATGELAREYRSANVQESIRSVDFSPDGRTFAFDMGDRVLLARNPFAPAAAFIDFDGDGRSDPAVYRDGMWYMQESANNFATRQFGLPTDKLAPADFDGDGKTDIAVWRDGTWYWLNSSNGGFNATVFGTAGDIPVPADFSGDGRAELAVYRAGVWWTHDLANNQSSVVQFGISTDKTVPADYDGDGKIDYAIFRDGAWHYLRSSDQGYRVLQFGFAADTPTVGDYDGDRRADAAVYRDGTWYVSGSSQGFYAFQFGIATDIPAAADYDGDGKTDAAVFRDGIWYRLRSQAGVDVIQFGIANDRPVQSAFVP